MRRLLVDTHVPLWYLSADERLDARSIELLESADVEVHLSVASVWEIAIKSALGRLDAPEELPEVLAERGFRSLPISEEHAWAVRSLPRHHADPFDRLIIAQSIYERMDLLTFDRSFTAYDVALA